MDIDLPEDTSAGVNKAMRRVRGNDDDAAGVNFARVITDGDCRGTFERECHLYVRMRVQWWTLAWFSLDNVGRKRCALFFAVELI